MDMLFLRLLNISITASWLVLLVLVLRLVFRKAPRWMFCVLWLLVGLRLVLPFSVESVFSLIPSAETVPQDILYEAQPAINSGFSSVNNVVNPVIYSTLAPTPGDSVNPLQVYSHIAGIVWAAGLAAMLIYAAVSWILLKRRVLTAVRLRDNIYQSEAVNSPFVLGIIRPKIYLPYDIDETDAAYVIEHEKAHISRGDHLIKPLGFVLLSVYWFNPVIWAAYVLLCRDIELACDEKVIEKLGQSERKPYSLALLNQSVSERRMIAACPLAFGEVGVKERIKSVMNYKKPAFWGIAAAVVICIVTAVCFLTDPAGIKLTQLDDCGDYSRLTENVAYVEIYSGAKFDIVSSVRTGNVLDFVENLRIYPTEVSQSRSEEREGWHIIILKGTSQLNYNAICFSKDCSELWIENSVKPTLSYRVTDPEAAMMFFEQHFAEENMKEQPQIPQNANAVVYGTLVGYSHNGSMKLSVDALNRDSLNIHGGQHTPIMKISSAEELEAFRRRYANDFTLSESVEGMPSFDSICTTFEDESFFADRTLFIVAIISPTGTDPYRVVGVTNDGGVLKVLIDQETNQSGWTKPVTWFFAVGVDNDFIAGCTQFDAQTGNVWLYGSRYVCRSSPDWGEPEIMIYENGQFTFIWSALSSYIARGAYDIDGEFLIMRTEDGLYEYTFRIAGDTLVFMEDRSSPIPSYRYSADGEPQCPVGDGALFQREY